MAVRRLSTALGNFRAGVHHLGPPAAALDVDLPPGLVAVYREFDGAEMFHDALVLFPSARWTREDELVQVGEMGGDGLWVDLARGSVWRSEEDTGELLEEGTSFERWLLGWVEAEGVLYDREGEFVAGVIDADGELAASAAIERERRVLKRDRGAAAPRWRLARALARAGKLEESRRELEQVVSRRPHFGWAWYDLSRLSETLGELDGAREEAVAAAEADPDYEHAGFFWGWAARLAALAGDDRGRAALAARARKADPDLVRRQVEGAVKTLDEGEIDAARELCQVALAVEPRDLAALELSRRIDRA